MALRPTVIQLASAKAPPNLSTRPFQEMRMMEGMRMTMMLARRLRHWAVRSAFSRLEKTVDGEGRLTAGRPGWWIGVVVAVVVMVDDILDDLSLCLRPDGSAGEADEDIFEGDPAFAGGADDLGFVA